MGAVGSSYTRLSAEDAFWGDVPLFRCLPKEDHPKLTACSKQVEFEGGEVIFAQSEPGDEFFVIQEGRAQVLVDNVWQAEVGVGDYFGEIALISSEPRTATIKALTPLKALKIHRQDFQSLGLHSKLKFPKRQKIASRHKMMANGATKSEAVAKKGPPGSESTKRSAFSIRSASSNFDGNYDKAKALRFEKGHAYFEDQGAAFEAKAQAEKSYMSANCEAVTEIITDRLNILAFFFVPMGQLASHLEYGPGVIFIINFMAIIPLASILGAATEALACHTGQLIGGLLNATFGNAVEMIMCVQAVKQGLIKVVQGNLLGSILSNLLLVLGMSIFASGTARKTQKFNQQGAASNMTCQLVASISVCLPTCFASVSHSHEGSVLCISRICAVFLMATYGMFLFFMLKTHADLFGDESDGAEEDTGLSPALSVLMLFLTTIVVFLCSECLIESIEGVSEGYGLSKEFIGVILLPIVGNAAEHATAVTCAYKGMMDLALGVAVGSSTQIALFVVPCAILFGWYYDQPMNLNFSTFDTTCQMLTVFLVSQVLSHGETNWLHGAMLMVVYVFIATQCLFIVEEDDL